MRTASCWVGFGVVGLAIALAACGKATDGTCEERNDCSPTDDASPGDDGQTPEDDGGRGGDALADADAEAGAEEDAHVARDAGDEADEAPADDATFADVEVDDASHDAADAAHPVVPDAHVADVDVPDTAPPFDAGPTCTTAEHLCSGACYPNTDLPTDDPCVITDAYGVFVSSSLGSAGGAGTLASPYKTISAGLAAAATAGKRLYVCAETYPEAVALKDGVASFGYFTCSGGHWAVSQSRATVSSPTIPAATATNLTKATRVDSFSFIAPNATQAGASSYGMFVSGTTGTLTLVNDAIQAGSAGAGLAGGTGPAQGENPSCNTPSSSAPGTKGQGPSATTPASTPQYTSSGYVPSTGGSGSPGPAGDNGTAGGGGACTQEGGCQEDPVAKLCEVGTDSYCASAGTFGCGGPAGAAGLGATGGGASIALYVWQSKVTLQGGTLTSHDGGNGGKGGTGLAAPVIANSQCPSAWPHCLGKRGSNLQYPICGAPPTCAAEGTLSGGAPGGNGGQGGPGGDGAGGSGGGSLGYYDSPGSTVSAAGVSYVAGKLGSGGSGGGTAGAPGPSGTSAPHN